jgi:hypothetical protein
MDHSGIHQRLLVAQLLKLPIQQATINTMYQSFPITCYFTVRIIVMPLLYKKCSHKNGKIHHFGGGIKTCFMYT